MCECVQIKKLTSLIAENASVSVEEIIQSEGGYHSSKNKTKSISGCLDLKRAGKKKTNTHTYNRELVRETAQYIMSAVSFVHLSSLSICHGGLYVFFVSFFHFAMLQIYIARVSKCMYVRTYEQLVVWMRGK